MSHKEHVGWSLFLRDPLRDVGHPELHNSEPIVSTVFREEGVFGLTQATTSHGGSRKPNTACCKLSVYKMLSEIPKIQTFFAVKVWNDLAITLIHPLWAVRR